MGKGDSRNSLKMRRRKSQKKVTDRNKRIVEQRIRRKVKL